MSDVRTVAQSVQVDDVADIQVSETVDMGDGTIKRAIRIYGPLVNGAQGDPVLTVFVTGPSKDAIAISTPTLNF